MILFIAIILCLLFIYALIKFSGSELNKETKIACVITLFISSVSIIFSYTNMASIKDEVSLIGVIATIMSIPIAVLLGWNIYTVIDIKKIKDDYDNLKVLIEKQNKDDIDKYKKGLSVENEKLKDEINSMKEDIKSMDIFGDNKGKCAEYRLKKNASYPWNINAIRERIVEIYLLLGIPTSTFLFQLNGFDSIIVFNGGISKEKSEAISEMLKKEYHISDIIVRFGPFENLTDIPVINKLNN